MSDDIVARLRLYANASIDGGWASVFRADLTAAADEIERLRNLTDKWTEVGIWQLQEILRLRNELAARCGDGGAGAHTAGPTEHFIPEAL